MSLSSAAKINMSDPRNKRQHILDAAYIVFSRKGFHRATVDEIISLADTGKGTVYNYFVNKEQLFYTVIKERSAPFYERIAKLVTADIAPLEKVHILTREFLNFYAENADLWRVLMHEMRAFGKTDYSVFNEEQQIKYRKNFENTLGILESVLAQGIKQECIKECNTKQAAYGLFSTIITLVFQQLVGDDRDATAKHIANTFLFGVAAK